MSAAGERRLTPKGRVVEIDFRARARITGFSELVRRDAERIVARMSGRQMKAAEIERARFHAPLAVVVDNRPLTELLPVMIAWARESAAACRSMIDCSADPAFRVQMRIMADGLDDDREQLEDRLAEALARDAEAGAVSNRAPAPPVALTAGDDGGRSAAPHPGSRETARREERRPHRTLCAPAAPGPDTDGGSAA